MTELNPTNTTLRRRKIGIVHFLAILLAIGGLAAIAPANAHTVTTKGIFSDALAPSVAADPDRGAVELGVKFSPTESGQITALQYYQSGMATGVTQATLWSSRGYVLARTTFTESSTVGWRTVPLQSPVTVQAGRTYVASYHAPKGGYPVIVNDFTSARTQNGFNLPASAGVYAYGSAGSFPNSTWKNSNYLVDVVFSPTTTTTTAPSTTTPPATTSTAPPATSTAPPATTTSAPAPTTTTPPATTTSAPPATTTASPTTTPASGGLVVLGRSFPSEKTTGVPAGTSLTPYTGPCTIQVPNTVIDAKIVNCALSIQASGVTIKRSQVNGTVYAAPSGGGSFTISDSWVNIGNQMGTGIGDGNFVALRVHVTGGNRSINCYLNCTVQDSYVHGQFRDDTGRAHESGIRMGSNSVIRGNTIACTAPDVAPDAGCSAALTGYGDFAIVQKNTIDGNLFVAGSGGYCTYGGSSTGKPYSAGVNNIKFTNNVWQRGASGKCGFWGPITSFDSNAPGNVWSNNLWDDGKAVPPAN